MADTAVRQIYRIHSEMVSIFASALPSCHDFLLSFPVGKVNLIFLEAGLSESKCTGSWHSLHSCASWKSGMVI